jgi:hypothetical protein
MALSSRTHKLKIILIKKASRMSFSHPTLHNKMGVAERKNRTLIQSARTIHDEYKTSDRFWAEAINTTWHAIDKPNVSYFRVFGSKCYVLLKRPKSSKFAPKVYEGCMLGYDSNSRVYCVFNKDSGCVKTTCNVVFDKTNGSQMKQYDLDDVDGEKAPCDALRTMAICDVRPQEVNEINLLQMKLLLLPKKMTKIKKVNKMKIKRWAMIKRELSKMKMRMIKRSQDHHHSLILRVRQSVQRDHSVNNILGAIEKGVTTQSRVATFCEHYSFIFSFEPFKVEDALQDLDLVVAIQ